VNACALSGVIVIAQSGKKNCRVCDDLSGKKRTLRNLRGGFFPRATSENEKLCHNASGEDYAITDS